jgi:hypothetical protein
VAQIRFLRGGRKAIASTLYILEKSDSSAQKHAKELSRWNKKKISKSAMLVKAIEKEYPA